MTDEPVADGNSAVARRNVRRGQGRSRRSSEAVRGDLIRAAREVFGARGYSGARTKEIAERAKATEKMLFAHFRTKEELFQQTVFEPFGRLVATFLEEFEQRSERHLSGAQLAADYVTMVFDFLCENRRDVLTLLTVRAHHPELFTEGPLDQLLPALEGAVISGVRDHGSEAPPDAGLTVRVTFGMILAAAVFGEQVLDLDPTRERERLLRELASYVSSGVVERGRRH